MKEFENKVVLITGSSRGIGKATAIMFAQRGAKVVINYLKEKEQADKVVIAIKKFNPYTFAIKCDVSNESQVISMMKEIVSTFGGIDILVNNAGIATDIPIEKRSLVQWNNTLSTNLTGQFLCIKHASQQMKERRVGKIINIASTSALYSFSPDIVDYDVSKAGVIALTKNYAKALAPNIQVNAIAPGWVNTEINKALSKEFIENEIKGIYSKRFANPDEIAEVILFLASNKASFITGSTIVVDGGHD